MKKVLLFTLFLLLETLTAYSQNDLSKMIDKASKIASPEKESKVELAAFSNIPIFLFSDAENKVNRFTSNGAKTGLGLELLIKAYHNPKNNASLLVGAQYIQNPYEFKWYPSYGNSSYYTLKGEYAQYAALMLSDFRYKLAPESKNWFHFNGGISCSFLNVGGDYNKVLEVLDLGTTNFNVGFLFGFGFTFEKLDLGLRLQSTSYDFSDDNKVSAAQCQLRVGIHL